MCTLYIRFLAVYDIMRKFVAVLERNMKLKIKAKLGTLSS